LPQHEIFVFGDLAIRAYQEATMEVDVNPMDDTKAMQARIKEKSLFLKQKLGKLIAVANLELGDHFLAQIS
jgi:hypothetical protein